MNKLHKDKLTTAVVLSDLHCPYQHKPTLELFKQVCSDLKPDYFVNLGDAFDAEYIGQWTKENVESGIYKTVDEIKQYKQIHESIVDCCDNEDLVQLWCGGNHDWQRIKELIREMPGREELLDLKKYFPDVDICEYNKNHKIGKLYFTHGIYTNDHHAKKTVLAYGASVLYGHTHTSQCYSAITIGGGKPHMALSSPVACQLNPTYMKNRPSSWVNGFTVVYFKPNGEFQWFPVYTINNECIFNNKLYKL